MYPENEHNYDNPQHWLNTYDAQVEENGHAFLTQAAYLELLDYLADEQAYDKGVEVGGTACEQYPFSAEFYLLHARFLLATNAYKVALDVLKLARLYAPAEAEINLLQAEALIGLDQTNRALEILDKTKAAASATVLGQIYIVEAQAYLQMGSQERAFFTLKAAVESDPTNLEALEQFATCTELVRKYRDAVTVYDEVLVRDAYNAYAWYHLAHAYEYLGEYEAALEAFDYAFLADENHQQACRDAADLHLGLKQYQAALEKYEVLFNKFEPNADGDLQFSMGQCYEGLGMYQSALLYLREAIRLDPLNDEALFHLGACYAQLNEWQLAARYVEQAIDIEDSQEEYYALLGEINYHLNDPSAAADYLWEALDRNDEEVRYWMLLASFLMEEGDGSAALDVLEAGEDSVEGGEIRYYRVACLFGMGRRQEALYRLGEALLDDFDAHTALFDALPDLESDGDVLSMISDYATY